MKKELLSLYLVLAGGLLNGQTIDNVSAPASDKSERRDVYVSKLVEHPKAVLVLCPGQNMNGRDLLEQEEWKQFARENKVALAAISFASDERAIQAGSGYFDAGKGSGERLLKSVRKTCGEDLPLLLYGFSGGAHFVNSFVNWKPGSVLAFCAYSAGWWEPPALNRKVPHGIVACGADDAERYSASQRFFSQGRAGGKAWTWLSLGNTGHQPSKPLDEFVRVYFATLLEQMNKSVAGEWRDIDTKASLTPAEAGRQPTLASWLPNAKIAEAWGLLHQP